MDSTLSVSSASVQSTAESLDMAYGASLADDAAAFEASLASAEQRTSSNVSEVAKAAFEPLNHINQEALSLSEYAKNAVASGNELTPAEIIDLTVKSQKFMFHSQLTANVANRSADGIQQLFRQQG